MQISSKKAFTVIELIFVIVVIGILSAIAIPKFAATRDDATITKTIATIGSVRSALATERQKRILRGEFLPITSLNSDGAPNVFSKFSVDSDGNTSNVLEYAVTNCADRGKTKGCWTVSGTGPIYVYNMPVSGSVDFNITKNRFDCDTTDANCKLLTY